MYICDLSKILNISQNDLNKLESEMIAAGFPAVLDEVEKENSKLFKRAFSDLGFGLDEGEVGLKERMRKIVIEHEKELYRYTEISPDNFDFEKFSRAAKEVATAKEGFFLKKEYAKNILQKRPPENTMEYLGYDKISDMLEKEDVGDIFSALRFTESDDWMHETFRMAYSEFTLRDFEFRKIELRVLNKKWKSIAEKYVAKKRHNVSHLKEFGIVFLNPIAQTAPGNFLRDFALLLHYFHEIDFYSKLFQFYSKKSDFNEKFISLLRGDVLEKYSVRPREWLIVQRYLWKDDPSDLRLFLPRVNPEAMHWRKASEDLVRFGKKKDHINLDFWEDLDSVAVISNFANSSQKEKGPISFELEDNAMTTSDFHNGKSLSYFYHQREALWNKIFAKYVGGYDKMENMILENMDKGMIKLT